MILHHVIRHAGLSTRPAIFLHGSGGDETDLMELADRIAPRRPTIFLRGTLPWEEGYAFFRRYPDRSLDLVDLEDRAAEIGVFLSALKQARTLALSPILIGYSNGAVMAEALLRRMPRRFSGAVLMRPLSPDLAVVDIDLSGKPVLLTAGDKDERRAPEDAPTTAARLRALGAHAVLRNYPIGHALSADETTDIASWLAARFVD
jgi:phospholipase/carboxylesterase